MAALLIGAAPAHAACDEPAVAAKAHVAHRAARGQLPPLAIGDSTMVLAVPRLAKLGLDADARACRGWAEGLAIVRARKRAHRLPSLVVMALGANSTLRPLDIERGLRLLGPHRVLGLPTHFTWARKAGPDTAVIHRMARRYPKRIKLIDWVHYAKPHPSWFRFGGYDDGLHTNPEGSSRFADFIAASLS